MGEVQIKENVKQPKVRKQKKIWWRVLLAWVGGFLAFPLVLAGASALLGTVFSTKQVVSMFGGNPDEILGEELQDKTILQSVMAIIEGVNSGKYDTLEGVNTISPLVKTTVEDTLNNILKGILGQDTTKSISWDDIKGLKFTDPDSSTSETGSPLADELKNQLLESITLAAFLGGDDLDTVYKYFIYPTVKEQVLDEYGNPVLDEHGDPVYQDVLDEHGHVIFDTDNPYSLNFFINGGASSLNGLIDSIMIGDVIDNTDNNQLLNVMEYWKLSEISSKLNSLTVADIFGDDVEGNRLLTAIKDWSLDNFGSDEQIEALKVGDLFDTTDSDDIMKSISDFYIGNLKGYEMTLDGEGNPVKVPGSKWELTDHLMVDTVLGDVDNQLLNSFKGKTLKEMMNTDINTIKLRDLIDEDVYVEFTDTSAPDYAERHDKFNRVFHAIMENQRKKDYDTAHTGGFIGTYEDWLDVEEDGKYPNREYNATVNSLTDSDMFTDLKLGDILDIEAGSLLDSYKEKTISELEDLDVNDVKLADLLDQEVYVEGINPSKYNKVIGAIMENERRDNYEAYKVENPGYTGTYEEWLDESEENRAYTTTVGALSNQDTIDNLYLKDVVDISDGTVLNSFKDKKISELSSISIEDIYLKDLFDEEVYIKGLNPSKYNKVIGAIMENDRVARYEEAVIAGTYTGTLEEWKAEGHYDSKANVLTSQESIDGLKLSDVIDNPNDGSVAANLIDALDKDGATIGNLSEKIREIEMGKLFGVPTDEFGHYVSYDECRTTIPYVLYSLRDTHLDSLKSSLNTLKVGDAMEVFEEDVLKDGYTYEGGQYYDSGHNVVTKEEAILHAKSSPILIKIKDIDVANGEGIVDILKHDIKLGEIIPVDEDSPLILQKLENTELDDVESEVTNFAIKDIMEVYKTNGAGEYVDADGNPTDDPTEYVYISPIIGAMADVKIFSENALQTKMDNLKFNEVFTRKQCEDSTVLLALWDNNGGGNFKVNEIGTAMQNVTIVDIIDDGIYSKYADAAEAAGHYDPLTEEFEDGYIYLISDTERLHKKIDGKWWYLLTEEGETFSATEEEYILKKGLEYKVSDMTKLVDNMAYHIRTETLFELHDAGILTCPRSQLEKVIPMTSIQIGTLTIEEFINAI